MKHLAVIVGVVLTTSLVWLMLPTEEALIIRKLEHLADAVSIGRDDYLLARGAHGARIGSHFTVDASIDLGRPFQPPLFQ